MSELKNKIYNWLNEHKDEFLSDLASLIEIPSVEDKASDGKPYGEECARALDTMLSLCEKHGLSTKNFDYHAGTAIFEGKNNNIKLDILSHLDVV
ncbi:MAG: dipeptidase, partial [Clostridia bacterium]|nr:dipeptidase [Clostridia bacterium]